MKWVLINDTHINMSLVEGFFWSKGYLVLGFAGKNPHSIADPDKKHYIKLCRQIGIMPYEERSDKE